MRTYGTIVLHSGSWSIQAEPHVSMRFKRIFPRALERGRGELKMSDSTDVRCDLAWGLERYPLVISKKDRARLDDGVQLFNTRRERVGALVEGIGDAVVYPLAEPAREYQRVAANVLLEVGGLLLADEVGLGKTVSAICALVDPRMRPALVVTLAHLPKQWKREINRFAPDLSVYIAKSTDPDELLKRKGVAPAEQMSMNVRGAGALPDVIILNYHKLRGWQDALRGNVRSVVFDEAQELRKKQSQKWDAAKAIADEASYRLGLSATPVYNQGGEVHNVISCISADALGSWSEFAKEWVSYGEGVTDPRALGAYLRECGVMLRRTRSDVRRELPPVTKCIHAVECDEDPLKKIDADVAALATFILGSGGSGMDKMRASEELSWKLRLATGLAKAAYIAQFVNMLVESGEKVLLYAWHRLVYDVLEQRLSGKPVFFTGAESASQKQAAVAAFISGESQVLVMSLRAGAGIDGLQHVCKTVVIGELDWSPGVTEQCIGRIYRDGQPDPVIVYILVADSGSDPVIVDVLDLKAAQVDGIRTPKEEDEVLANLEVDGERIKRLAESVLAGRGAKAQREMGAAND